MPTMTSELAKTLGAEKVAATLLVLFIPSVDRYEQPVDQAVWVDRTLEFLGLTFGGATAFPKAKGVWRDDARASTLVFDEPVIINCYASEELIEERADELRTFLMEMGTDLKQGAVGLVIDRDYLEITFPLEGQTDG
jgi:hypothetical protein